jgi:hypothetical protein
VLGIRLYREHRYGKEAWLAWKAERIAKGDRFEWKDLVPPEVPDEENFAMAPLVQGAIKSKDLMDPRFEALKTPEVKGGMADWRKGTRENLQAWADAYGKPDLLTALAPFEATLRELDEESRRPKCRLPIHYEEFETPALLSFRGAARTLRLRALANLQRGRSDLALKDVQTCLRIAHHLRKEPNLLAGLLNVAIVGIAGQPVWEGLQDHRWSEAELKCLEDELGRLDLLASARLAWEGERMMHIVSFSCLAEGIPCPKGLMDEQTTNKAKSLGALGKGWIYRNLLELDRFWAEYLIDPIQPSQHQLIPKESAGEWLQRRQHRKDLVMALIAIPALVGQLPKMARLQTGVDQARIAIALERFRRARGRYPESLSELSPTLMAQIPNDVMTGQPLHYKCQGDTFLLYSVGWDLKDDGGAVMPDKKLPKSEEVIPQGDWPWVPLPPLAPQ